MKTMKLTPFVFSVFLLAASCNSKPKITDTSVQTTDTIAASQAIINEMEPVPAAPPVVAVSNKSTSKRTSNTGTKASTTKTGSTTSSGATNNTTEAASAEPAPKTGWSKTAKGAVIGGVVGAGSGAVINRKNRAAGAVIGGVVGAGAGAVIGNEAGKKDGRH